MDAVLVLGCIVSLGAALVLLLRRRPWVLLVGFFLFLTFLSRAVSTAFIDLFGPQYSEQLGRNIGPGSATPFLVFAIFCVIASVAYLLRPQAALWRTLKDLPTGITSSHEVKFRLITQVGLLIFVFLLYFDLLSNDVIPLFSGMERYDYAQHYAGPAHRFLFEHGFIVAVIVGYFFVRRKIVYGTFDWFFLLVLASLFIYGVLTGHRFSAFYLLTSFFLIPCGAYLLGRRGLRLKIPNADQTDRAHRLRGHFLAYGVAAALLCLVLFALANSFFDVRYGGNESWDKLMQRVLIQPAELWWLTWERAQIDKLAGLRDAVSLMFINPIDDSRNTGIQFLMVNALGINSAIDILSQNSQFAGGYPEVFVESLGTLLCWPVFIIYAWIVAILLQYLCWAILRGYFLSTCTLTYLYFAFTLHYIGGMLNFLIVWTFWAKVAATLVALIIDSHLERQATRLNT